MTELPGADRRERSAAPAVVGLGAWCDLVDSGDIRRRAGQLAPFVSPVTSSEDATPGVAPVDVAREVAQLNRQASFDVHEFADLADGRRVTLHRERGFSISAGGTDPWPQLTEADLRSDVLTTVLPDDENPVDEHPFDWLAGLCAQHGIEVTSDQLRVVPYVVVLSRRVVDRLSRSDSPDPAPAS